MPASHARPGGVCGAGPGDGSGGGDREFGDGRGLAELTTVLVERAKALLSAVRDDTEGVVLMARMAEWKAKALGTRQSALDARPE